MVLYYNKNKFKSENDDSQMCWASCVGLTNLWLMGSFCMTPLFWMATCDSKQRAGSTPELTAQFSSLSALSHSTQQTAMANAVLMVSPDAGMQRCGKEDWDILLMP